MKIETSQTFGNGTYVLSDREIAAMITELGASPSPESPLAAVDLSTATASVPEDFAELREALAVLCAPDHAVDIRTWPDGGGWIRYFGPSASGRMAAYSRNDAGANLIVWPVTRGMLKSMITAPLAAAPAEPDLAPGFSLSFDELLALGSLIDVQQEATWRAMADRNSDPEVVFDAAALKQSYAKGVGQSDDPRWMVSRLAQAIPGLPDQLPQAETSLARFADIRMLLQDVGGHTPLPSVGLVFQQIAGIEGFAALAVHDLQNGTVQRRFYQANRAQIWGCFLDGGAVPGDAVLRVLAGAELSEDLDTLLPAQGAAPGAETAEPTGGAETIRCLACGAENRAGQKFCSSCGASLTVPPAEPAKRICPNCGATLAPGDKFCTQCGHPAD